MTVYALPNVQPFVRDVANQVGTMFGIGTIYGWRATSTDMTGHPAGLALDFVVGSDKAKGDSLAAYFLANYQVLNVKYVLWQQRKWAPGQGGWKTMEYRSGDRPGYDPNHMRHVHVSFTEAANKGNSAGVVPSKGASTLEQATTDAETYGNEADSSSWVRTVGDAIDNATSAITDPLSVLTSGDTWKRVAYVVGGAGLIVMGVVLLVTSSREAQSAILAAVPHPAAKAAAAATAVGGD